MGLPVQGSVYRLFQGVSRQPDPLRLEGQVEEAVNVWMSVVSGGFEPRPGSELFFSLNSPEIDSIFVHSYRRGENEAYLFLVHDSKVRIFNRHGVLVHTHTDEYLATSNPARDIKAVTAGDTTFLANRKVVTKYAPNTAPSGPDVATITCVNGDNNHGYWSVKVTIGGTTYSASKTLEADTSKVIKALATGLNIPSDTATVTVQGSTMVIQNKTMSKMSVVTEDFWGDKALELVHKIVDDTNQLPSVSMHNHKVAIGADPDAQVWMQFVADNVQSDGYVGAGRWIEAVAPGSAYMFDRRTLPIALKNSGVDTFHEYSIPWEHRKFGFQGDIFEPEFIGKPIEDITFHRDRLVIVSGESIDCSKQGDFFMFFPEKSIEVLDTDPFSRTASSRSVNFLYHAIPFRSQLFIMSENGQFELRGDPALTPRTATLELATQYQAEPRCAPAVMGSELYFAATIDQNVTTLFEYYFEEASVSHTATNATTHVEGFVPGPARQIVTDSVTNSLFLLQDKEPNRLYVYKTFWEGTEKRQASWSFWEFDFPILSINMFMDRLLVLTSKGGLLSAYQLPLSNKSPLLKDLPSQYHLDSTIKASSVTKDWEAGTTTAVFPQAFVPDSQVFCVFAAGEDSVIVPGVVQEDGVTVVASAVSEIDYSVYAGYPFESYVTLSRLIPKDQQSHSVTEGRTQIRRISIDYEESAQFDVTWSSESRQEKRSPFRSYETGNAIPLGRFPDRVDGTHNVKLRGRSDKLRIRIGSNQPYPYRITGIRWKGSYHDKYGG